MRLRDCLKNFLTKAEQKEDLGIYCVKLTKIENLHGFLVVAEPVRLSLIKMLKSLFLVIGISQSSVSRICRQSLGLTAFRKTRFQDLSDADKLKRVIREKRLLRFLTVANVNKNFFTEKLFKLNQT